jgi:hypothetical protein
MGMKLLVITNADSILVLVTPLVSEIVRCHQCQLHRTRSTIAEIIVVSMQ